MCLSQLFPPYKTAHTHTIFTHVPCFPHAPFASSAHLFPPQNAFETKRCHLPLRSCRIVCFSILAAEDTLPFASPSDDETTTPSYPRRPIHDERPRDEHENDEQRDPEREIGPLFRAHHRQSVKVQHASSSSSSSSSSFHQVRRTHDDDD